jgi:lysophospholipase L1-like esterase
MIRLATGAQIPLVIAIQPEITGRSQAKLSPREQEILKAAGTVYQQRVQIGYAELAQANQQLQKAFPKNVRTLNFYKFDEDLSKGAFYDTVHLTEEGNAVLAERLYRSLTSLPKLQVIPPKRPK